MRIRDMAFGVFLLAVCAWLFVHTESFFVPPNPVAPPSLWPRIVLAILAALAVVLIITNLMAHLKEVRENKANGVAQPKFDIVGFLKEKRKVMGAMAVTLIFLFTFVPVGFIITCTIYFLVITYILEPTKNRKILALRVTQAVVLTALIYLVFMRGLNVQLPPGPFPAQWFM